MSFGTLVLALLVLPATASAQLVGSQQAAPRAPRPEATTIPALLTYPLFYHAHGVLLRGHIQQADDALWLVQDTDRILLSGEAASKAGSELVEVRATFFDVGRLEPDDPRMALFKLTEVSQKRFGRDHPGIGELLLLRSSTVLRASPPAAPTIRAIALEPTRYLDQRVTVTGRFRGRNLYGDLPNAPGQGRWDFVLNAASAAIWVTGIQPKGRDFNLNPGARVDTSQWLEVAGAVRHGRGLTWIEATSVAIAQPPPEPTAAESRPAVAVDQPPPDVVFSAPTPDETGVDPATSIRIQFSREMDPKTFEGRVRLAYTGQQPAAKAPAIQTTSEYRGGTRVLEIKFSRPLERFRTVQLQLLEGITASDGTPMKPWTLTFSVGG